MVTKRQRQNSVLFQQKEANEIPQDPVTKERGKSNSLVVKLDHLTTLRALTPNQQTFFDAYNAGNYFMMLSGSAGVGKSFIAIYKALSEVLDRSTPYDKLIIIRSAVQSRDVGFLPGSLEEKMSLYELPYHAICSELFNRKDAYQRLKENGKIEFIASSFLRGVTFNNAIVVIDEMQNMTFHELQTAISRIGQDSKVMFLGDYRQNDLIKSKHDQSGLWKFHSIAKSMREFVEIEFTTDDIVRSDLVKSWLVAQEKWEDENERGQVSK